MEDSACAIAGITPLRGDAIAIDVESPAGFDAQPGQFVKLTFDVDGEAVSRFYTISSPDVTDTFELTIELDPDGEVSPLLEDLEPGDELVVSGPFGRDFYEGEPRVVILAGGPGIGPAVGIAERALADGGDAAVVYLDDDPLYEDRLTAIESDGAFVSILGPDGDFDAAVAAAIDDGAVDPQLFIYGFADFIDRATSAVGRAGGEADAAKIENFG